MLTLTRRQARCLRGVFRRHTLGIATRGSVPPLVLRADGAQLRARYRFDALAVEHALGGDVPATGSVALPLDALADVEGRDDSPVDLEAVAPDRTVARWTDRGIPQSREYAVAPVDRLAPFPEPPDSWSDGPPGLLDALAEAAATGADDNTRYALNCIQLKGDTHEVVATDGRQLLVQGSFRFPWEGDVLIKRSPVFAATALPRDRPVSVGKTDARVVLRAGPWTLFCDVQDARFPRVDRVIPDPSAAATRLRLDPDDASFLAAALGRLPGAGDLNAPATLELNGRVAVRARGADQTGVTELVLSRSRSTGPPVRVHANREFLARAIRLGFGGVEVVDADSPVVCRDGRKTYCFQPLSKEAAIGASDDAVRIESTRHTEPEAGRADRPTKVSTAVSEPEPPIERTTSPGLGTSGRLSPAETPAVTGLAALINEAKALHEVLTDARARTGRLVVALRRHRKRERLVTSTLESLKQLKLQEVDG